MENFTEIIIYTDGACRNSGDKTGGWGAVLMYMENEKRICGVEKNTTSNRMELLAAIKALKILKRDDLSITLHSDSQYLIRGVTEWSRSWIKNNWIGSAGTPVVNKDLWLILLKLNKKFKINWVWVRGHAGHAYQEVAHNLADKGMRK